MEDICKEPDTLNHKVLKSLMKIFRLHRLIIENRVRQTGVYRSQHQILMCIASNPGITQKEIARFHETSTATIAVSLKKLEKAGYIRRAADREDNRCNRIQVTEQGQAVVNQSYVIFQAIENEIFAGFSEEDFRCLDHLLSRVYRNMDEMNERFEKGSRESGQAQAAGTNAGKEEFYETI